MSNVVMTEAAREARNAYYRNWYAQNKDKVARTRAKYWERKASEQQAEGEQRRA